MMNTTMCRDSRSGLRAGNRLGRFAALLAYAALLFGTLSRADAQAAAKLVVSAPTSVAAGAALSVTVTAKDAGDKTVAGYTGTVSITSTDPGAKLPESAALKNGVGTFSVTMKKAGSVTVTATDTAAASITGVSGAITVTPGAATHLYVVSAPTATSGKAIPTAVAAKDAFNNTVTDYAGTVKLTTTDTAAVLPENATLKNGVGIFSVSLKTAGSHTITATDTAAPTVTGASRAVTVSAAP